ncbi:efflux RND transporter periplasmic adaptor subunit [Roseimaritima ulvae]|uniref:HlyD family secretion protein n=1 Tax=Roseimaritima ulvae TaxID=980254 RepID=A0A5B9QZ70_9BACT|nr:MchE protein [Roseimaritima ulvae]QEG39301.1 HlyD family secretion protein [Roseimaritima ulvae]
MKPLSKRLLTTLAAATITMAVVAALWYFRDPLFNAGPAVETPSASTAASPNEKQTVLEISTQARKNLGLVALAARPQAYWRTVLIPGQIADRPGLSDRGVTSPAVGVVSQIHAYPGDTLQANQPLFTLRLFSEYLQNTQSELFKASREIELIQQQIERLAAAAQRGAVPETRLIELRNQLSRQNTLIQAYRQDLLTRGLAPAQIEQVANGTFVSTIEVSTPPVTDQTASLFPTGGEPVQLVNFEAAADAAIVYEVQDLKVELGQQVQAGQVLASLANHQSLYVVGHAFKREALHLEQAAQQRRPLRIEFVEDAEADWPALEQTFLIRHLSNSIDPASRTLDFFVPLQNQSRSFSDQNNTFVVWRFRPGQRARIYVPVEKYEDVFVLPSEAVVREGPEAYVFRQNGDLFKQLPVHVVHEDRDSVVIANDGSITPGVFLAQNSAASLNRVLKAQSASGEQPGLHVHPDGTVHAAH